MATFNLRGQLTAKTPIDGKNGKFYDLTIREQRYDPNSGELWSDYLFSTLLFNEDMRVQVDNMPLGSTVNIRGVVASKEVTTTQGDKFHSAWLKANQVEIAK